MNIYDAIQSAIFTRAQVAQQQQAQQQQNQTGTVMAGLGGLGEALAQTVDVEQTLEEISREKGSPNLNWRTSIVDLMKLLDLDSSLGNRAQLATELGYTGEKNGSAEMNIFLHRRVMEELEKNGGQVPDSLKQ
jgi:hypothetical protein